MVRLVWLGLALCLFISAVEAGCRTKFGVKTIKRNGKKVKYCETDDGFKMLIGSKPIFKGRNCYKCECTNTGLKCCSPWSLIFPPFGCAYVIDGCEPIFVNKDDNYKHCQTNVPVWEKSPIIYFSG